MITRYFTSYTGVKLPLKLIGEIEETGLANRNTYILAEFDDAHKLLFLEHRVYGEPQLSHRYEYHTDGSLKCAEINNIIEEEMSTLIFDESGNATVSRGDA